MSMKDMTTLGTILPGDHKDHDHAEHALSTIMTTTTIMKVMTTLKSGHGEFTVGYTTNVQM